MQARTHTHLSAYLYIYVSVYLDCVKWSCIHTVLLYFVSHTLSKTLFACLFPLLVLLNREKILIACVFVGGWSCVYRLVLVESIPVGMEFNSSVSYPSIYEAWRGLLSQAQSSLDISSFYWTLTNEDTHTHEPTANQVCLSINLNIFLPICLSAWIFFSSVHQCFFLYLFICLYRLSFRILNSD